MQKILRDKSFRVIGYVDEESNGDKTLRDSGYRIKGYYYKDADMTKDASFRTVGYGDILVALLFVNIL